MSLSHAAKTKVRLGSKLLKEFWVQVDIPVHRGSILSPLFCVIVVDVKQSMQKKAY